jgi:DNA-binding HxlR family transcriptional regulator
MDIIMGKWKIHILAILLYQEKMRFMDFQRDIKGIGPKMLSKELQDLEMNLLITRTIKNTKPITVEYELTNFGKTLEPVILNLSQWGVDYKDFLLKEK